MLKNNIIVFLLFIIFSSYTSAQSIKVLKQYDGTPESYLVAQIRADTLATGGLLPDRVYHLENGGIYLNTEIFNVQAGQTIRIKGIGKKPIIYQYPTGTGANPTRPPGNLFVLLGGNLEMTNVAVTGIFEPIAETINDMQGGLINTTQPGSSIIVDDCILSNVNGQPIRTGSATVKVKVTNTIFANLGSLTTSNFGAGKGIDLREASCDSLILIHNTFVNYQDRPVRHYNFGNPLAGTGIIDYCIIDHNTFINGMSFHGLLSLGNVGTEVKITNNLFMDAYALGEDSTDVERSVEWGNTGEFFANGNHTMPWIFTAPNDTTQWTVANNYYSISPAGQAFLNNHPPANEGSPLSQHIKGRLGAAAATAFTKVPALTMNNIPNLMIALMEYYWSPTGGNKTKNKPNYDYTIHDMDRRPITYYIDNFDASYNTTSPAYTGADRGLPVGDLNWFPDKKVIWSSVQQIGNEITTDYRLEQNYPNPFNPTTNIVYSLPKATSVSIVIYNSLGQEVTKLLNNQQQSAGQYNISWNGKDNSGRSLASGIYFYQLQTQDLTLTKKMMLIK